MIEIDWKLIKSQRTVLEASAPHQAAALAAETAAYLEQAAHQGVRAHTHQINQAGWPIFSSIASTSKQI